MFILEIIALLLPMLQPAPQADIAVQASQMTNAAAQVAADETLDWQINRPMDAWRIALRDELSDDTEYAARVEAAIDAAVLRTGADPAMLWSVAYTESHGRHWKSPGAVKRGGSGEIGMMQVMPFWEKSIKKKYSVELDLFNLEDNMVAGALVLSRGGETPHRMLSYYNTGQRVRSTAYQRKVMQYWSSIEEIPETVEYKDRILQVSAKAWD